MLSPIGLSSRKPMPLGKGRSHEYHNRTNKVHSLWNYFIDLFMEYGKLSTFPEYEAYYVQGNKDNPNAIRTVENTDKLFQDKLILKWENDKRPPKWTKREVPQFYADWLQTKNI